MSAVLCYGADRAEASRRVAEGQALGGVYISSRGAEALEEATGDA